MAINKNFVVKNGLEVSTDLLLANAETGRVGIGTTRPAYLLEVQGGIGVTDIYSTGITTIRSELRVGSVGAAGTVLSAVSTPTKSGVGIGTTNPGYLLDVRGPVSVGQTVLYVKGDAVFTGDVRVNDIFFDETEYIRVSGIITAANLYVFNTGTIATGIITTLSGYNLYYSGIGTFANLNTQNLSIGSTQVISSDRQLQNISSIDYATIAAIQAGISTASVQTFTNLNVTGISTLSSVKISSGIVTAVTGIVTYYGDGRNLTGTRIGIGSEGTQVSTSGTTGTSLLDFKTTTGQNLRVDSNSTTGITTVTITPGISLGLAIALSG